MLLHAPKKTSPSLLSTRAALSGEPQRQRRNGAPACSPEQRRRRRLGTAKGTDLRRESCQDRSRSSGDPRTRAARTPGEPQPPPPRQVSCSFQNFSLRHLCSSSLLLRSRLREPSARLRGGPHRLARAAACRAFGSPRGNFWTRWWCPLGEGEPRSVGTRRRRPIRQRRQGAEPGQGGTTLGGGGPGHPGSRDARAPNAGRRWRGDRVAPEPGSCRSRAALEWLDLGCDSSRLGRRRTLGSRPVPAS